MASAPAASQQPVDAIDVVEPVEPAAEPQRIVVTTPQHAAGLCLFFHTGDKRQLYRLAPVRDPRQPRLWGFAVFPCLQSGLADFGGAIWYGGWGASRPELETVLAGVRADADAWFADDERATLREALLTLPPPPPAPEPRKRAEVPASA